MPLVVRVNANTIYRAGRPLGGSIDILKNLKDLGFHLEITGEGWERAKAKCLTDGVEFDSVWDTPGTGGKWAFWVVFGPYTNYENWKHVWEDLQEVDPRGITDA